MTEEQVAPENDQVAVESAPEKQPEAKAPEPNPVAGTKDYNWAEARRKMDALERQNQELQRAFQESQKKPEQDEIDKLGMDDIVTKRQVLERDEKVAKRAKKEALEEMKALMVEDRIRMRHADFEAVVTPENIEMLKQKAPALAQSLSMNSDPYAQAVAAYEAIKAISPNQEFLMAKDKEKAEKNAAKPKSASTVSTSPIGQAHAFENGLTPELRKSLYKEMVDAAKKA